MKDKLKNPFRPVKNVRTVFDRFHQKNVKEVQVQFSDEDPAPNSAARPSSNRTQRPGATKGATMMLAWKRLGWRKAACSAGWALAALLSKMHRLRPSVFIKSSICRACPTGEKSALLGLSDRPYPRKSTRWNVKRFCNSPASSFHVRDVPANPGRAITGGPVPMVLT